MTNKTEKDNYEAVMAVFDAWSVTSGVSVLVEQQPHENEAEYIRVYMLNGSGFTAAMGGGPSTVNRHPGILQASVFTPLGQGAGRGLDLGRQIADLLESALLAGMEFRAGSIEPPTTDEGHLRHDVTLEFTWDRLVPVRRL